jgi:dTDP-4-dehydrorhamnose 3,5-epimerase-like enzyme
MNPRLFEPIRVVKDQRGSLIEISRNNLSQINLLQSTAGTIRGNHYHRFLNEVFFVIAGNVSVNIENVHTREKETFVISAGKGFYVYINEAHTLHFLEDCLLICMYDNQFDVDNPDIYAWRPTE